MAEQRELRPIIPKSVLRCGLSSPAFRQGAIVQEDERDLAPDPSRDQEDLKAVAFQLYIGFSSLRLVQIRLVISLPPYAEMKDCIFPDALCVNTS